MVRPSLLLVGLVFAAAAAAHTGLTGSEPADGALVPGPVTEITLTFADEVRLTAVALADAHLDAPTSRVEHHSRPVVQQKPHVVDALETEPDADRGVGSLHLGRVQRPAAVEAERDPAARERVGSRLAFATGYLCTGGRRIVRMSGIFALPGRVAG